MHTPTGRYTINVVTVPEGLQGYAQQHQFDGFTKVQARNTVRNLAELWTEALGDAVIPRIIQFEDQLGRLFVFEPRLVHSISMEEELRWQPEGQSAEL